MAKVTTILSVPKQTIYKWAQGQVLPSGKYMHIYSWFMHEETFPDKDEVGDGAQTVGYVENGVDIDNRIVYNEEDLPEM